MHTYVTATSESFPQALPCNRSERVEFEMVENLPGKVEECQCTAAEICGSAYLRTNFGTSESNRILNTMTPSIFEFRRQTSTR